VLRDFLSMHFDRDEPELDLEDMVAEGPEYRATITPAGKVRIVSWGPWLASTGPVFTLLRGRSRSGVAIADLSIIREEEEVAREVVVDFLCGDRSDHRETLCRWAKEVGYMRVWFDGEVVELDPSPGGLVETRCTGCGQRFVDGRSGWFWNNVRRSGTFPVACSLCGSDLPQWTPVERAELPTGDAGAARRAAPRAGHRAHRH
jgi:hypothetical protein